MSRIYDDSTPVFRVGTKMFALTDIDSMPLCVNLKWDPFLCEALRQECSSVKPVYHMSKKHWNTVVLNGSIPDERIFWMIDMSYELVLKGLTKMEREDIKAGLKEIV